MTSRIEPLDAQHMRFAESAWHHLGKVGEISNAESLSALDWADAHLDSPFFMHEAQNPQHEPEFHPFEKAKTVVLDRWPVAHGHHSDKYKLVQHSFLTRELLPKLLDAGLVKSIESVGTYGNGEAAFVSVRLPNDIKIDGYSEVHNVINLTNGYDKLALSLTNSLGIVVCANTMQTNVLNVPSWHTFKHMGTPAEWMSEAMDQVVKRLTFGDQHGRRIELLLDQDFVDVEFHRLISTVIGEKPNKWRMADDGPRVARGWTEWTNKRDQLWWRWCEDPDNKAITGTAWGALMAVQAYEQKDLRASKASGSKNERHHQRLLMGKLPLTAKATAAIGVPKVMERV